jgi:hypothetical protein
MLDDFIKTHLRSIVPTLKGLHENQNRCIFSFLCYNTAV